MTTTRPSDPPAALGSRLLALIEASLVLNEARDLDSLLRRTLDLATANVGAERGAVFVREPKSGNLVAHVFHGDELEHLVVPAGQGLAGAVATTGETLLIADAYADVRFDRSIDAKTGYRTRSILAVPLRLRSGEVVGVLEVLNKVEGGFTGEDAAFLQAFGAHVAVALENARLVEERVRAERLGAVGTMAAALVHDLSNPLSGLRGYADVIQQGPPPEVLKRALDGIRRQGLRMTEMVKAILAYVRGERRYLPAKTDVDRLLDEVVDDLRAALGGQGVVVERTGGKVGAARVDPAGIRRLLDNLARNAAAAMQGGGRLTIHAVRADDRLRLEVRDTGRGLPESVRARLFQPFATEGTPEGTGFGLPQVKEVVDAHRGTIEVESAPGKGTTFRFSFPAEGTEDGA